MTDPTGTRLPIAEESRVVSQGVREPELAAIAVNDLHPTGVPVPSKTMPNEGAVDLKTPAVKPTPSSESAADAASRAKDLQRQADVIEGDATRLLNLVPHVLALARI